MHKFKVGDKVILTEDSREEWLEFDPGSVMCLLNTVFIITDMDEDDDDHPYLVETVGDVYADSWMAEYELEHYVEGMEND
jgi:hypothetical protein